ncbi:hypothetical protein PUN28_000485 [Cardiocondyla obscurior]|uniref:Uncharacterized protein n=1 Tax=Cardiocondyla obscurior TaxID=286306 RepID=A0AAW2H060_9HYME
MYICANNFYQTTTLRNVFYSSCWIYKYNLTRCREWMKKREVIFRSAKRSVKRTGRSHGGICDA